MARVATPEGGLRPPSGAPFCIDPPCPTQKSPKIPEICPKIPSKNPQKPPFAVKIGGWEAPRGGQKLFFHGCGGDRGF